MTLTKHNTALDLSKLTEGESSELFDYIRSVDRIWSCWSPNEDTRFFKEFRKGFFGLSGDMYSLILIKDEKVVDFHTFKSIHFPEQDDKPTYEELVEALREVNRVFPIRPGDQDSGELTALWQVEQLLERIK